MTPKPLEKDDSMEDLSLHLHSGDLLTREEFEDGVDCTCFTDDDGFGYAVYGDKIDVSRDISPSDATFPDGMTHVLWFNK